VSTAEILKSAQFVVGQDGKPLAVQLNIQVWEALLDWLAELEDRALIKAILPQLRKGPQASKALNWKEVSKEWDEP
jgi:hypothetical protein